MCSSKCTFLLRFWYSRFQIKDTSPCYATFQCNVNMNKGGSRTGAPGVRPTFEFFGGFVFVNLDCKTHIYFYCGHHTVFTICSLFSTVTKTIGYVWMGHQNKPQTPKILPRRDHGPQFWNSWIRYDVGKTQHVLHLGDIKQIMLKIFEIPVIHVKCICNWLFVF